MRLAFLAALAVLTTPTLADAIAPGLYCPVGEQAQPILVDGDGILIDGLDCSGVSLRAGRVTASRCYANSGSETDYDGDLSLNADGTLKHDGITFRLYIGPRPCP